MVGCCAAVQIIPVGAVQALVNVSLLSKIPPFKQLLNIAFTNAIIVSILPGMFKTRPSSQLKRHGCSAGRDEGA